MVTLKRALNSQSPGRVPGEDRAIQEGDGLSRRTLAEFSVSSVLGNERLAIQRVAEAVQGLNLPRARMEKLKTAVAEATMNAMEHGNEYRPELPVKIQVAASNKTLSVQVIDQGGSLPAPDPEAPDLEAKLAGLQRPRGWGLYLIKNMVDEMQVTSDGDQRTVELIMHLEGEQDGDGTL